MAKHDAGHGRRHTPEPVKVTRRPTRKPPPTVVPPAPAAPTPPSELATAARRVLAATAQIFLTCDASGVLPPIARLNPQQAMYHFISGYTSKIAGTEIGLGTEPQITFSACFGAPFMVHHPFEYARLLQEKMSRHGAACWLVNTGWTGGPFGLGKRMSIHHTRALLDAAIDGNLQEVEYRKDKLFGFEVPRSCPNVPADVLDPASTWGNKDEYWKKYDALAARYLENFKLFADGCAEDVRKAGPRRL